MFLIFLWFVLLISPAAAQTEKRVPILMYHHLQDVGPEATAALRRWSVSPQKLEDQLAWLAKNGFETITMGELIRHLKGDGALPAKPVVLSFDDGWKEHYHVAFPLLKKYQAKATFFIITGSVGHSAYMNWQQVKEMAQAGMDMQAHSVTHAKLTKISKEQVWQEISQSKKDLESQIQKPVEIFAYPYGAFSGDILQMVQKSGYAGAAAVGGLNAGFIYRADPSYTMDRSAVMNSEDLHEFAARFR